MKNSPDPGVDALNSDRHRSNWNIRRSIHSLASSLSISEVELRYQIRLKAATARVQV